MPRQLPPPPPEEEPRWTNMQRLMVALLIFMAIVGVLATVAGIPLAALGGKGLLVLPGMALLILMRKAR